ncbi:hypothetical protein LUZ60_005021 [Juncus effusus]|nr:hypothetical protein LUZ60_005021 [Juncus effusus]
MAKKSSFQQNLFEDRGIEPISGWISIADMQELLRNNKLTKIPDMSIFNSLLIFDVPIPSYERDKSEIFHSRIQLYDPIEQILKEMVDWVSRTQKYKMVDWESRIQKYKMVD